MDNRFIIIVGSYNNAQWVSNNIGSILAQDYNNYLVYYFDDASTDNTYGLVKDQVKNDTRFKLFSTTKRHYKTWFFSNLGQKDKEIQDNDILVFLDGDDSFHAENVLSYLNEVYNKTQCWMTYGGMVVWEGGDKVIEPNPQNSTIPPEISATKSFRKDTWRTSHLKTMRGFVWKKFDTGDLFHGKYIVGPDDLAIMFAALELCPPKKVYRVTEPIYLYNHSQANNKSRAFTDQKEHKVDYEGIIRARKPYDTISFVTPTLAGGLGNQMFEIAAAASLAKDNNAVLIVNNEEHILPNQGRNVKKYQNNIFSKIVFDSNIRPDDVYRRDVCTYEPIPYKRDLKLLGHFQSWKYFHHNREYIQNLFTPHDRPANGGTAIQVRRGDYYKFPDHHPQLTPEYYTKAVKLSGAKEVCIYSDDIPWCEKNLKFDDDVKVYHMTNSEDWIELILMSTAKNLIISNSSFGFWAAYLNTQPDKKIFVPSVWFGKAMIAEGFNIDDLVLPDWIKV